MMMCSQNKTTTVYESLDSQLRQLNIDVLTNPDYSIAKKALLTREIQSVKDSVQLTYTVRTASPTLSLC